MRFGKQHYFCTNCGKALYDDHISDRRPNLCGDVCREEYELKMARFILGTHADPTPVAVVIPRLPDQRIGQAICNTIYIGRNVKTEDVHQILFYIEDADLLRELQAFKERCSAPKNESKT